MKHILFIAFLIGCFQLFAEGVVPQELLGSWVGESKAFLKSDGVVIRDSVRVEITFHENFSVTGKLGNSILNDCIFAYNRGKIGKFLNVKSDYIVKSGTLVGKISENDSQEIRRFTVPCNIKDNRLRGTFMQIFHFSYPYPVANIDLEKQEK